MKKSLVLFTCIFLAGCSFKRVAVKTVVGLLDSGTAAFYEEQDVQFARETMGSQLKLLEALLKNDPKNKKILLSLAQGLGGYAFMFLEDEDKVRARYFYRKGLGYGKVLLGERIEDLKSFKSAEAPALFWTAYCWAGWASLNLSNPDAIADLPKVEAMVRRAEELHPGYFFSGPDLLLGAYYGARPKMFGGDLKKAKAHFEKATGNTSNKFLMAQVLMAKYHAVPSQDREAFKTLLDEVINAPSDLLPEQGLSNQVAKEKAKKLLEKIDELF